MKNNSNARLSHLYNIKAFTLIEVLLALAVVVIGLVPLLHLLTTSILLNDSAWNLSQATLIANARLAEVIVENNLEIGTRQGSIESRDKENFFDWQILITEANIKEIENTVLTGLRKVTVIVIWHEGQNKKQISLTTYVFVDNTVTKTKVI